MARLAFLWDIARFLIGIWQGMIDETNTFLQSGGPEPFGTS